MSLSPKWQGLCDLKDILFHVEDQRELHQVFPPKEDVFNAFKYFEPEETKVVIIGQDPYHQPGQANGLAFSVAPGVKIPPSLRNIFKEMGKTNVESGDLTYLAKQGVLLINTTLTVKIGRPNSHFLIWRGFTKNLIKNLSEKVDTPIVFMLWGNHAKKMEEVINKKHIILKASHPSPLSVYRGGWFGTNHFAKVPSIKW
jgi:uracil-DNA glycosylase